MNEDAVLPVRPPFFPNCAVLSVFSSLSRSLSSGHCRPILRRPSIFPNPHHAQSIHPSLLHSPPPIHPSIHPPPLLSCLVFAPGSCSPFPSSGLLLHPRAPRHSSPFAALLHSLARSLALSLSRWAESSRRQPSPKGNKLRPWPVVPAPCPAARSPCLIASSVLASQRRCSSQAASYQPPRPNITTRDSRRCHHHRTIRAPPPTRL